jgi:hypothetical protein
LPKFLTSQSRWRNHLSGVSIAPAFVNTLVWE